MFRILRYVALLVLASISSVAFAAVECAAFSKTGALATASIKGTELSLTASQENASQSPVSLKVGETSSCSVSFSADQAFVAVSLFQPHPSSSGVQVAIFDIAKKGWVNGEAYTPRFARLSGGFVGETHQVATAFFSGEWQRGANIAVQIYTITPSRSGVEAAGLRPMKAPTTAMFENSMDSPHNRLWYRNPNGKCGIRSVVVLGEDKPSPEIQPDLIPACYEPSVFEFPSADEVIVGAQTAGKIQFWRVDLPDKHVAHLDFAPDPKREFQLLSLSSHSPDGKIVGIAMRAFQRDKFGGLRDAGYEIALLQVDSWELISTVSVDPGVKSLTSLAVDHREGHATLEAFGDDHWTRKQVDLP